VAQVVRIRLDQPAGEAFALMRERVQRELAMVWLLCCLNFFAFQKISGVAVVDQDDKLVGVISASDLKVPLPLPLPMNGS